MRPLSDLSDSPVIGERYRDGGAARPLHHLPNLSDKGVGVKRLADKISHTRIERALSFAGQRTRCQSDDRQGGQLQFVTDLPRRFGSIEVWHVYVHEYHV